MSFLLPIQLEKSVYRNTIKICLTSVYPDGRPAPHLSAPSVPLFLRLRRSPLGASVAFEMVPHQRLWATPPGQCVIGSCEACAQGHCTVQLSWPVRTFSKWVILHCFPNFYTLRVEIFWMFFPLTSAYDPYEP